MEKLDQIITITPEVVSSAAFYPVVKQCVYRWEKENNPESNELQEFKVWAEQDQCSHFPVVWGSGWACDVPLYLNYLVDCGFTEDELYKVIDTLHNYDEENDLWPEAFRIARLIREGKICLSK